MNPEKSKHRQRKPELSVQISKSLSYFLRHGAIEEGLKIDKAGYVCLDEILAKKFFKSRHLTYQDIKELVDTNSTKRFELKTEVNESGVPVVYIRASQGHSIPIEDEELLEKIVDPTKYPACLHGTHLNFWAIIKKEGLKAMKRTHIHFSPSGISGIKASCNAFIDVDMEKAIKDGIEFYLSKNNVIVSRGINGIIPPKYFKKVTLNENGNIIEVDPREFLGSDAKNLAQQAQEEHKNKEKAEGRKFLVDNEDGSKSKKNLSGQYFQYLCVLDFQAQCDKNKKLDVQEIIEFPVVIIDIEKKVILDELIHYYIKPVINPQLFPFCTELTGITQEQVDKGMPLTDALNELDKFLKHKGILDSKFCFVTCGDWDFTSLKREAKAKNIDVKPYLKSWINLKQLYPFSDHSSKRQTELVAMLRFSNMEFIGREYSGMDNAHNLARVVISLLEEDFKLTSSMTSTAHY